MVKAKDGKDEATVIKKYANRRLYDTGRSSYVTLEDLSEMIQEGHNFIVLEAKTGKDITRSVLTQIIADQEAENETLLPTDFMRTLISFYGNNVQAMVPSYLEQTMNVFKQNQEKWQERFTKSLEGMGMASMESMFPKTVNFEEVARKNMKMFERAIKMMPPFNMANYMGSDDD